MKQNRFKSWVVYTAVAAQIFAILLLAGILAPEAAETGKNIVTAVLEILVLLGVLNNPTSKDRV